MILGPPMGIYCNFPRKKNWKNLDLLSAQGFSLLRSIMQFAYLMFRGLNKLSGIIVSSRSSLKCFVW